ncbi:hypothetical protein PFISCL1PPCAC_10820, partial [Pristionchus fissidentatus]
ARLAMSSVDEARTPVTPPNDDDGLKSSGSEAKRSRYGSSSSDEDDAYSNFNKMLEKKKEKFAQIEASHLRLHVTEPKKLPSPKLDLSSDSDSDIEEVKEQSTLAMLLKKGKKFNEDREKNLDADMNRIKEMAKVSEAEVGALPNMVYQDAHAREAEMRLRRLKEDRRVAMQRRASLDTVDCVVIDGNGEYTEREYEYNNYSRAPPRLSGIKVTFLLQDLHLNDTKIEKLDYDMPIRCLVEKISKRWECNNADVMLTLNNDTVISDISMSPKELNIPLDGIHPISAVYVVCNTKKADEAPVRDANAITIKFQSGQGRPAHIDVDKTAPFSDILDRVAEALKMDKIGKLVFDCEKVDFSSTPQDLDMDDEDCVDVYAA